MLPILEICCLIRQLLLTGDGIRRDGIIYPTIGVSEVVQQVMRDETTEYSR